MSEKSTVNVNVKTSLLNEIRSQNLELTEMPTTWIVDMALRRFKETQGRTEK